MSTEPRTLAVFQLKENLHPSRFFRGQSVPMLSMVPPCRSNTAGSQLAATPAPALTTRIPLVPPIGTSLHAPAWVGRTTWGCSYLLKNFFLGWQLLTLPFASWVCFAHFVSMGCPPWSSFLHWVPPWAAEAWTKLSKNVGYICTCLLLLTPFPVWIKEMLWPLIENVLTFLKSIFKLFSPMQFLNVLLM